MKWHSFWTLLCSFTENYLVFADISNFKLRCWTPRVFKCS